MTRRLRDSSGFTLVELLVSMTMAVVTLGVTVSLVADSQSASLRVTDRVDAAQRGRTALEQITQQLRSQVCLGPSVPAIVVGENNRVRFYADLRGAVPFVPDLREIAWFADGRLVEMRWTGTGTAPATTFNGTPRSRALTTDTGTVAAGEPVFRYYAFDPSGAAGAFQQLATPLSAGDRARVVKINIRFRVKPTRAGGFDRSAVAMQTSIYARTADPTDPTRGPACL